MGDALKFALFIAATACCAAALTAAIFYVAYSAKSCEKQSLFINIWDARHDGWHEEVEQERNHIFNSVDASAREYQLSIVDQVNSAASTWTAAFNPSAAIDLGLDEIDYGLEVQQMDSWLKTMFSHIPVSTPFMATDLDMKVPERFDSREKWPLCRNLHQPTINQGACGSCWVVSGVSMVSDRICIHSNQTKQVHLSAMDVLNCLEKTCIDGGFEGETLALWLSDGIVTGGWYGTEEGCMPYEFASTCGSPCTPKFFSKVFKPTGCVKKCRKGYPLSYDDDKHVARMIYKVTMGTDNETPLETKIHLVKAEILQRGPVVSHIHVAEDFMHYKSGVYQYVAGNLIYGHAIKIIGWGMENGVEYWLAANSFGTDWGDRGFMKLLMRSALTPIAQDTSTGLPQL